MRSIADAFDPADNGITPLRLALAVLVLYSHSFVAGSFGFDQLYDVTNGQMQLGTVAVISFFGLSGFLLARRRQSCSLVEYVRNRLLRIVPGLWVCLAVTACVVVPIAVALGGRASLAEVVSFVINAGTFQLFPVAIDDLYARAGLPSVVNAPLWTLPPEMLCYLLLGLIGVAAARFIPVLLAGGLGLIALPHVLTGGTWLLLHLPVAFFVGALLFHHGEHVPLSARLASVALAVLLLSAATGHLALVAPLVIPYIAIWVGLGQPFRWRRDLSYGTYIYGWPIQQLLATAGVAAHGWLPYAVATLVLVLCVATLSALLVEEPALRLRVRAQSAMAPSVTA